MTARPGGRGRIGVIQPAPGVMIEHEWPRWLPDGLLFPVARLRLTGGGAEDYARLAKAAPEAARDLASADVGVIAFACTLGSLYSGKAVETQLVETLADASGRPAIALASACAEAFSVLHAKRIAVLTPYGEKANDWVASYAQSQGFTIEGAASTPMGIATVGDMPPAEIARLSVESLGRYPDADALWLPCTAMQTLSAIAEIEAATGRAVVSGSQALLWKALQVLNITDPVRGAGRLFALGE